MKSEKENTENNKIIKDTILTEEERKETNRNIKTPDNSLIRKETKEKKEIKEKKDDIIEKKRRRK
jgi:phosphatidylserine/phosphatidylglycerophosphate/cardiolipin synthase-like enzyme